VAHQSTSVSRLSLTCKRSDLMNQNRILQVTKWWQPARKTAVLLGSWLVQLRQQHMHSVSQQRCGSIPGLCMAA
jgi:hypothetical protein